MLQIMVVALPFVAEVLGQEDPASVSEVLVVSLEHILVGEVVFVLVPQTSVGAFHQLALAVGELSCYINHHLGQSVLVRWTEDGAAYRLARNSEVETP